MAAGVGVGVGAIALSGRCADRCDRLLADKHADEQRVAEQKRKRALEIQRMCGQARGHHPGFDLHDYGFLQEALIFKATGSMIKPRSMHMQNPVKSFDRPLQKYQLRSMDSGRHRMTLSLKKTCR